MLALRVRSQSHTSELLPSMHYESDWWTKAHDSSIPIRFLFLSFLQTDKQTDTNASQRRNERRKKKKFEVNRWMSEFVIFVH